MCVCVEASKCSWLFYSSVITVFIHSNMHAFCGRNSIIWVVLASYLYFVKVMWLCQRAIVRTPWPWPWTQHIICVGCVGISICCRFLPVLWNLNCCCAVNRKYYKLEREGDCLQLPVDYCGHFNSLVSLASSAHGKRRLHRLLVGGQFQLLYLFAVHIFCRSTSTKRLGTYTLFI